MKLRKYDLTLGSLIVINFLLCLFVAIKHQTYCAVGNSCSDVQNSIYGTILGIKVIWIGVICFAILFLLFLIARYDQKKYWIFFTATILGTIFAIYFLIIQFFVLKQICSSCVITDSLAVIMLIIVIFEYLDFQKEIKKLEKNIEKKI